MVINMPTPYEAQILAARLRQLTLVAQQQRTLDAVLSQVHETASKRIADTAGGTNAIVKRQRWRQLQSQLGDIIDGGMDNVRDVIVRDMTVSARYAIDARVKGSVAMLTPFRPDLAGQVPAAFATVPRDALNSLLARTHMDGKTFSKRIWDFRKYSHNVISQTVSRGILEGKSAYELSRELEAFLVMSKDEAKAFSRVWAEKHTEEWKAAWKTRGRLKYNAMRLARTEINHAFREGSVQSAKRAPWVRGLKWRLSASHPKPDICDEWASADPSGMGPGVYLPDDTPVDHPTGFCFVTDELVSKEELMDIVRLEVAA